MSVQVKLGIWILRNGTSAKVTKYDPRPPSSWVYSGFITSTGRVISWDKDGFVVNEGEPNEEDLIEVLEVFSDKEETVMQDDIDEIWKEYCVNNGKVSVSSCGKSKVLLFNPEEKELFDAVYRAHAMLPPSPPKTEG